MPNRILNKRDVPSGNYDYHVAQTGWTGNSHSFDNLVVKVREHMGANSITPPNDLAIVIEEDFCARRPELCRDNDVQHQSSEDMLTSVAAALAIPASEALAKLSSLFGINCAACNMRKMIIRQMRKTGLQETLRQLKGTF